METGVGSKKDWGARFVFDLHWPDSKMVKKSNINSPTSICSLMDFEPTGIALVTKPGHGRGGPSAGSDAEVLRFFQISDSIRSLGAAPEVPRTCFTSHQASHVLKTENMPVCALELPPPPKTKKRSRRHSWHPSLSISDLEVVESAEAEEVVEPAFEPESPVDLSDAGSLQHVELRNPLCSKGPPAVENRGCCTSEQTPHVLVVEDTPVCAKLACMQVLLSLSAF